MTHTVASSCVCTSPLAVMTIVALHDFVKVSISASLKSFLLIICIDAPESTTNSRSSGLRLDASKHHFSKGEKNVALSCSFNFNTLLASFHAASRVPCSCHSVSSWDRPSNFGALGLRWWGSPGQIIPSDRFWSRILVWGAIAFVNFTRWIGFCMSELFRKNRLRRLHVPKDTTQMSCDFQHSHCTLVIILFGPFTRLFINLTMCIRALLSRFAITCLAVQAFWRVPLLTEWVDASSFEVILARPSIHSTTGTSASGTSGSRWFSLILLHERIRRRIWWCNFSTLIHFVAETAIVSSGKLHIGLNALNTTHFYDIRNSKIEIVWSQPLSKVQPRSRPRTQQTFRQLRQKPARTRDRLPPHCAA